jgi:hypothetical protein
MKLTIFGRQHDSSKEIEIISDKEFGMKATIIYKKECYDGNTEVRNNLTEFHHLYNKDRVNELKHPELYYESAFESDIHGSGGTKYIKRLDSITIEYDTKLHDNI